MSPGPLLFLMSCVPGAALPFAEAVARAQAFHPEVQRAQLAVDEARAQRVAAAARLPELPQLSVAFGHRRDTSGSVPAATGPEWTLQLAQAVEMAGQRGLRLREVRWAVAVAQTQLQEARLQAAALGALDYVQAQSAHALQQVAQARAQLAQRVLGIVRLKEQAGASGGLERALAEVEMAGAEAQQLQAQAAITAAEQALGLSLGLPAHACFTLAALEAPSPAKPHWTAPGEGAIDHLVQLAVRERPRSQALLGMASALEANVQRLQREAVPNLALSLEAQHQQPGQHYVGGGVSLPLPLWRRQRGPRALLGVAQRRIALERRLFAQGIAVGLRSARSQLIGARAAYDKVHRRQLPAAQRHADMTVAAWQAGKLDVTQVVAGLRYLAEARAHHIEAIGSLWRAHIELGQLLGLLPQDAAGAAPGPEALAPKALWQHGDGPSLGGGGCDGATDDAQN